MKSKTIAALSDWQADIAKLKAEKGCDPNAITTGELSASVPDMSLYQAQRYFREEVQAGRAEKCLKMVNGKPMPAYRKVKSK